MIQKTKNEEILKGNEKLKQEMLGLIQARKAELFSLKNDNLTGDYKLVLE